MTTFSPEKRQARSSADEIMMLMTTMISTVMVLLYSQHLVEGRATITFLDISPIAFWRGFADQKISARRGGIGMMMMVMVMVMMNKTSGGPPPPPPPPGTEIPWPCFWSHSSQPLGRTHGQKFLDFEIWIRSARLCWLYFQPEKFPSKNCQLEWFLIPSGFSPFPIPSCRADIWSVKPPHQQHHLHYHHYYQEGKGTLLHLPYPFLLCRIPWIHPLCKGLLNSGNKKILAHTPSPERKTDNTKFL